MKQISFDNLPATIGLLIEKVEHLEALMVVRNDYEQENRLPDLMTVIEAAEMLGLTTSGIYTKVHKKDIPFIKLKDSNRVRFYRKQINAWLMESQQ